MKGKEANMWCVAKWVFTVHNWSLMLLGTLAGASNVYLTSHHPTEQEAGCLSSNSHLSLVEGCPGASWEGELPHAQPAPLGVGPA